VVSFAVRGLAYPYSTVIRAFRLDVTGTIPRNVAKRGRAMSQSTHQGSTATDNTVSRVMRIGASEVSEDALRLVEGQFTGILRLAFDQQTGNLSVAYDVTQLAFSQILPQLAAADIRPVDSWCFRLKAAWYDFTDQNTASQVHAKPKGCCNRIPGVYALPPGKPD